MIPCLARTHLVAAAILAASCGPGSVYAPEPQPSTASDGGAQPPVDEGTHAGDTAKGEAPFPGERRAGEEGGGSANATSPEMTEERPVRSPPPVRPYSGGACPAIVGGQTAETSLNVDFISSGDRRRFRLVVPSSYDGTSAWPLLFLWHWLNASSESFVRDGEITSAAEEMRFLAVLPDELEDARGNKAYLFDWPFAESWGAEKELVFFDDLLACVSEQYRVDPRRVYANGVSAGGLWVTYLSTTERALYLAAVETLSGGLGEIPAASWRMEFAPQENKFPALVLWGGTNDRLGVDFGRASMRYRDALVADGHFVVTCTHDAGHAMPPIPRPADGGTRFRAMWDFLLSHPYGLEPGASPYRATGLSSDFPPWCRIATP